MGFQPLLVRCLRHVRFLAIPNCTSRFIRRLEAGLTITTTRIRPSRAVGRRLGPPLALPPACWKACRNARKTRAATGRKRYPEHRASGTRGSAPLKTPVQHLDFARGAGGARTHACRVRTLSPGSSAQVVESTETAAPRFLPPKTFPKGIARRSCEHRWRPNPKRSHAV